MNVLNKALFPFIFSSLFFSAQVFADGYHYGIQWANESDQYMSVYIGDSKHTCMSGYEGQPNFYPTKNSPLIIPPNTPSANPIRQSWYTCSTGRGVRPAALYMNIYQCHSLEDVHANHCEFVGAISFFASTTDFWDGHDMASEVKGLAGAFTQSEEIDSSTRSVVFHDH